MVTKVFSGVGTMIVNPSIPLHRLVMSLSEGLDHVNPAVAGHQLRVAYMSLCMARLLDYRGKDLQDIFHAAALHDIGLVRSENRVRAVVLGSLEGIDWHGEVGYVLLKDNDFFRNAAVIVRHHHADWHQHQQAGGDDVIPMASYIISLADTVDRLIDREIPILKQKPIIRKEVRKHLGEDFPAPIVDAFLEASCHEVFWLDTASRRLYSILNTQVNWPTLTIDEYAVRNVSQIFARVVDAMSPWTATHTAGVTSTAVSLAGLLNFSPREQVLMTAAGNLHDLGRSPYPAAYSIRTANPMMTNGPSFGRIRIIRIAFWIPSVVCRRLMNGHRFITSDSMGEVIRLGMIRRI